MAETGRTTHVFVGHVQPADEAGLAVDDDDLPVVAEVDLEPVAAAAFGMKVQYLDACRQQVCDIGARKADAADPVIENMDADSGAGALGKVARHVASEAVVAEGVEFHKDIGFGGVDRGEDVVESRRSIDQQPGGVSGKNLVPGERLECGDVRFPVAQPVEIGRGIAGDFAREIVDGAAHLAAHLDIAVKAVVAEEEKGRHREMRRGEQEDDPTDRALRGSRIAHGPIGEDRRGDLEDRDADNDGDALQRHQDAPRGIGLAPFS